MERSFAENGPALHGGLDVPGTPVTKLVVFLVKKGLKVLLGLTSEMLDLHTYAVDNRFFK